MFTKQEIIERAEKLKSENPDAFRADLNLALLILSSSLFDKRLWSGRDYGEHPLHVGMMNTRSNTKRIIGFLHDVVEDSDWTLDDLRRVGFSERIVSAVDAMTHRENEKYFDGIERCSLNPDGLDKKIEDLSHNMDTSRNERYLAEKDVKRLNKYSLSRAFLVAVKKKKIEPGSSIVDFARARADFSKLQTTEDLLKENSSRFKPRAAGQG